jgi:cytohesin
MLAVSAPRWRQLIGRATRLTPWVVACVLWTSGLRAAPGDLARIDAVKAGDLGAVRGMIGRRVDVNQRAGDGGTALHWAVYNENQEIVDLLLRSGARVDSANALGVTPLWVAADNGSGAYVAKLLAAGADPNLAPQTGGTPLMLAARNGDSVSATSLIDRGADVNAGEEANGQTALMWAVAQRRPDMVGLLLQAGARVDARSRSLRRVVLLCCPTWPGDPEGTVEIDQGGLTPLLFAALNGDVASARRLLDAGANVNETAAAGTTALVMAAHRGFAPLVGLLLERGADPDAARGGFTALHSAVLRGDRQMVGMLLSNGASVNARLTKGTFLKRGSREFAFDKFLIGATPFLIAARLGDLSLMQQLVDAGADAGLRLDDGRTPLIVAAQGETTGAGARIRGGAAEARVRESVKRLMSLGADVNAVDRDGNTALHVLARRRPAFDSVIQLLLEHGALIEPMNRKGETPLALALAPPAPLKGQSTTVQTVQWRADYDAWTRNKGRTATVDLLRKLGASR